MIGTVSQASSGEGISVETQGLVNIAAFAGNMMIV
jgi:hypothetical protein